MNSDVKWGSKIDEQFKRQASWTTAFRYQLYSDIKLKTKKKILEVGCGTGVITKELRNQTLAEIVGIDINEEMLSIARKNVPDVNFQVEDVHKLPFKNNQFDLIVTHYVLLWLKDPSKALEEMYRVCKKGGHIVALAEPDYGAWVEYPDFSLGKYHKQYLVNEGADYSIGRKILYFFENIGLKTKISVIAQTWSQQNLLDNIEEEWKLVLDSGLIDKDQFKEKIKQEKEIIRKNQRMVFIPVFMAVGEK